MPPPAQQVDPDASVSGGTGTVFPDLDVITIVSGNDDVPLDARYRDLGPWCMNYAILGELKRSPSRRLLEDGDNLILMKGPGRKQILNSMRQAMVQAERQATLVFHRPDNHNTEIELVAACGVFWVRATAIKDVLLPESKKSSTEDDWRARAHAAYLGLVDARADEIAADAASWDTLDSDDEAPQNGSNVHFERRHKVLANLPETLISADEVKQLSRIIKLDWSAVMVLESATSDLAWAEIGNMTKRRITQILAGHST